MKFVGTFEANDVEEPSNNGGSQRYLVIAAIIVGVIVILIGSYLVISSRSENNGDKPPIVTTAPSTAPEVLNDDETTLLNMLPDDQTNCIASRAEGDKKMWPASIATFACEINEVDELYYAMFASEDDTDETYKQQAAFLSEIIRQMGDGISITPAGQSPCETKPNESGEWGVQSDGSNRGKYTCFSVPSPRIIWTDNEARVLGDATIKEGSIQDLITWWTNKAGPK